MKKSVMLWPCIIQWLGAIYGGCIYINSSNAFPFHPQSNCQAWKWLSPCFGLVLSGCQPFTKYTNYRLLPLAFQQPGSFWFAMKMLGTGTSVSLKFSIILIRICLDWISTLWIIYKWHYCHVFSKKCENHSSFAKIKNLILPFGNMPEISFDMLVCVTVFA